MAQPAQSTPFGTTQTEVGQDGGAHSNFPPFDPGTFPSQLVWLAIAFGFLYWYMSKRGLPQLGAVIDGRKALIARDLDEATAMQQKADAAAAAHEKTLAEARAKAQALAQAARDAAAADAQVKRQALEDDLAAKLAAAEREIGSTRAQAMANVAEVARDTAGAIVERLGGRVADPAAVAAAVRSVEQQSGAA
ncbi:MAG TPA: ATP F0F1 synthase subunit B [Roseiarcus sp.]|jgi:F-type H+-transporting ATPase subunit b